MAPKLIQLEDILRTYVMYNFDLGMWWELMFELCSWDLRGK